MYKSGIETENILMLISVSDNSIYLFLFRFENRFLFFLFSISGLIAGIDSIRFCF